MNIKKSCQSVTGNAPKLPSFVFHPESFLELITRSWTQPAATVQISELKSNTDGKVKPDGW